MSDERLRFRVTFFGDSICFGQGLSLHAGWVTRLSGDLEEEAAKHGKAVLVTNTSINGNTTRQALERMAYDVQANGVDLLVIQFGMNDCNHWQSDRGSPRVSLKAFAANLEEMIDRARRFGARQILLSTNHMSGRDSERMSGTELTYEQSNACYNEAIRKVARSSDSDVMLVDMEAAFKARTSINPQALRTLLQSDFLHLAAAGHQLYYETMKPALLAAFAMIASD